MIKYVSGLSAARPPIKTDVFDTVTGIADDAAAAAVAVGALIALLFVIITGWKGRGAITAIVSGLVVGLLFYWGLNNVTNPELQTQVTETVIRGHGPLPAQQVGQSAGPQGHLVGSRVGVELGTTVGGQSGV